MTITTNPAIEPSVVTRRSPQTGSPLRLSEAIRLGAMTTDQAFWTFADEQGGTCAVGAAIVALGGDPSRDVEAFEAVVRQRVDLSGETICEHAQYWTSTDIAGAIYHLNDQHRMPRNQIADWLAAMGL